MADPFQDDRDEQRQACGLLLDGILSERPDFDPDRIYHQIVTAGEEWADSEAAAELLEESKKTILAQIANDSKAGSVAAKEMAALGSAEYKLHVTKMVSARKEANRAKVRYDAVRVLAEMRRTQESTRRAEANIR